MKKAVTVRGLPEIVRIHFVSKKGDYGFGYIHNDQTKRVFVHGSKYSQIMIWTEEVDVSFTFSWPNTQCSFKKIKIGDDIAIFCERNQKGFFASYWVYVDDLKGCLENAQRKKQQKHRKKVIPNSKIAHWRRILGFSLNESLSKDQVKKRFRSLALKYHPDKGGSDDKMKEISAAYTQAMKEVV